VTNLTKKKKNLVDQSGWENIDVGQWCLALKKSR